MKEKVLLDSNKPFYKANLHCHSVYSDGHLTCEELKKVYRDKGYSIIAFTDHEHLIDHSYLTDENFLAITGCELAIKEFPYESTLTNVKMKVSHFNIYSPDPHQTVTPYYSYLCDKKFINELTKPLIKHNVDIVREYSIPFKNKMIKDLNEQGYLVCYNHPSWSLETAIDYLGLEGVWAVELHNAGCFNNGILSDEKAFDDFLKNGKNVFCVCADDNHNAMPLDDPHCESFGGFTMINCNDLSYDTVFNALKNGDFYASTGPEIHSLTYKENKVYFTCSNVQRVDIQTGTRLSKTLYGDITSGSFEVFDKYDYIRLNFTDQNGNKAYTQSYKISELNK